MKLLHVFVYLLIPVLSMAAASPPKDACSAPEFKQFDFWLGSWLVRDSQGKEVGRNEITSVAGGCSLLERWTGGSGITGLSLSYYDTTDSKWHQHWMGSDGQALDLTGTISGKAMVLLQEHANHAIDRVTWTPLEGGKVKQEWESSADGGKTWKTAFLGIYEHR